MTTALRVARGDSEGSINAVNQWMRSQPWYRSYLTSIGQDPNAVRLSDGQRRALLQMAQQQGVQVDTQGIEVDPAGNFNPKGHKLRNVLIGAGLGGAALATGGFGLGALLGAGGGAGTAAGAGAAAGAGTGAVGGGLSLGAMLAPTAIGAGTNLLGGYLQQRGANRAADRQLDAANYAADLERQTAEEMLAFQKEQEAQRAKEWRDAQEKNWQLEQARLARQAPFHQAGVRSLGQLLQPIRQRQPRATGTLG